MYSFKVYYNDGTSSYVDDSGIRPTLLFNDFDGLMYPSEFDKLDEKDLTNKKILELAFDLYKKILEKSYYRIEIVNKDTNEVIDFIEI